MNRIYPNWNQLNSLKTPLTEGERALLEFLDEVLPRDFHWEKGDKLSDYKGWLIFVQPFLNGSRPDVVIFHPKIGAVIYEVKDWNLDNYKLVKDEGRTFVEIQTEKGLVRTKTPLSQVNHYKDKIVSQLVPEIGELIDEDSRNFGLISVGLYFHLSKTVDARKFVGPSVSNYFKTPVIGNDFLTLANIQSVVPNVTFSSSKFWNQDWNDDLIFWFNPPFHSLEQGTPLDLRGNQLKIAIPEPGHHRVRGVAGSGKTLALAFRAARLAAEDCRVLVVTYNITLWHYIRDMISRAPVAFDWNLIEFSHFHGFCSDRLNDAGEYWPISPDRKDFNMKTEFQEALMTFFKSTVPSAVKQAMKKHRVKKFDAVLIDEGQDYHYEWYELLSSVFLSDRDELLVVSDKKQNIYERKLDWLDKRGTQNLDKFERPYLDLQLSYRMPAIITQMTNEFSQKYGLNQELKGAKIVNNPVLFKSHKILWRNISSEEWLLQVLEIFDTLKKEEYNPTDMVILVPSVKIGNKLVEMFQTKGIQVNHVFDSSNKGRAKKKTFWMGDARLKVCTVHSFKGWELLNIVIYIPEFIPEENENYDSLLYTAMTRARENLIVLNANSKFKEFGDQFPSDWD